MALSAESGTKGEAKNGKQFFLRERCQIFGVESEYGREGIRDLNVLNGWRDCKR